MVEQLQLQHKRSWSERVRLRIPKNERRVAGTIKPRPPRAAGTIRIANRWGRFPKWDECVCSSPLRGPRWCAGGFQILILERAGAGQTVVGQLPMTCAPLATQATAASRLA
jgi:hypothetical protein